MQKYHSTSAGASRGVGVNLTTSGIARQSRRAAPSLRSIVERFRRWLAGQGADIQVIAVQRTHYSIIT